MKVIIAGAGSVGRSVARELLANDHEVLLVDSRRSALRQDLVPGADWLLADACELGDLPEEDFAAADVVVAATGDDKSNLVLTLLAKSEFGVPRTVARVNHPRNEWLFDENWGVDVAVSTPRLMTALVEEAVEVGDLVHLMEVGRGGSALMEFTVDVDSPASGALCGEIRWPAGAVLTAILRGESALPPSAEDRIETGDELFFLCAADAREDLLAVLVSSEQGASEHPPASEGSDSSD